MKLSDRRVRITELLGVFLVWSSANGYRMAINAAKDPPKTCPKCKTIIYGHIKKSYHNDGLAVDFDLYDADGNYLPNTDDYRKPGEYWESLDPLCTWGGRFGDGCHFSYGEGKRK